MNFRKLFLASIVFTTASFGAKAMDDKNDQEKINYHQQKLDELTKKKSSSPSISWQEFDNMVALIQQKNPIFSVTEKAIQKFCLSLLTNKNPILTLDLTIFDKTIAEMIAFIKTPEGIPYHPYIEPCYPSLILHFSPPGEIIAVKDLEAAAYLMAMIHKCDETSLFKSFKLTAQCVARIVVSNLTSPLPKDLQTAIYNRLLNFSDFYYMTI